MTWAVLAELQRFGLNGRLIVAYFYKWNKHRFPNLCDLNHHIARPPDEEYNCFAWAVGDNQNFWWPIDGYWPRGAPRRLTRDAFFEAFATRGFTPCQTGAFDPLYAKIALYEGLEPNGTIAPTHAARQLTNGCWASKMGKNYGIEHYSLDAVAGGLYRQPIAYLAKSRTHYM